jgi:hypothetical protein
MGNNNSSSPEVASGASNSRSSSQSSVPDQWQSTSPLQGAQLAPATVTSTTNHNNAIDYQQHERIAEEIRHLSEVHSRLLDEEMQAQQTIERMQQASDDDLNYEDTVYEAEKARIEDELNSMKNMVKENINAEFREQLNYRKHEIEHIMFPENVSMKASTAYI